MDVTELLHAHREGRPEAFDRLLPLVYQDLRRAARSQRRRLRAGDTLDTTALVHEAYLRLVDQTRADWKDRGHFMAVSATAMRQILIDHARERLRLKRGGDLQRADVDVDALGVADDAEQLLDLDRALTRLAAVDPRQVRVVECRYFAGLSEAETAEALGISLRTAQREWLKARAWLRQALGSRPA
ncbi:MAG: ECF-type sigma factor [Vicinamibacterales bacterium]